MQCLRYQSKRVATGDISRQFESTVGDSWGEALLVNGPQGFEIITPESSQINLHSPDCNGEVATRLRTPDGVFARINKNTEMDLLLLLHPKTYYSHQRETWGV
jgi:hypothetical protein